VWALFFLLAAFAWAQPFGAPKPIFPDDTQDPKQAGGAELLEAVCPGHVAVGESIACKIVCPDQTDFKGEEQEWSLNRVTRGHFQSPTSDDAALSMSGCESHAFNNGGTILLTRQSGGWAMLWYKGGVPTKTCHRGKLQNGREIFICLGEYGGQGNIWTDLYIEDLLAPSIALMSGSLDEAFFETFDNIATCGYNPEDEPKPYPLTRGYIERVQFQKAADGTIRGLSVFARHGARTMTPNQVKACMEPNRSSEFWPATKPYRVDFKFEGKRMVRTGGSPGAPK
jgi:hypothetical protein